MNSFLRICSDTEKNLGRKLNQDELIFLRWVFKRFTEEQYKKNA
ncbi:hypothetical protein [Ornithinibacillus halophilus]|uniref:Uncharacterized protein n=1 Tax=Ornithinibacillus halophilus TaxID=930117 RepID=A0A1M5LTW7_9BACI|nr:hypothetical protein [Ornithinibacillus halophilus]SHG68435.1 hypothetical protein SAMN05216225_105019 [Ornithinibacillus halophilus]